ncbi:hypothetical protein ACVWWJ_002475 [Luteibacter sp. HA06]|jgi:hypothetical protein
MTSMLVMPSVVVAHAINSACQGSAVLKLDLLSPFPLAAVIAEAVKLKQTLTAARFPLARHHTRVIVVRAQGGALVDISAAALQLLAALESAVRPSAEQWPPRLEDLLRAVDHATDVLPEGMGRWPDS